ncbi:PREDICTED: tachykinins [Habropoda laboriosa]|nr:PREDICTED: tachykinins [Habropoda laboriosa]
MITRSMLLLMVSITFLFTQQSLQVSGNVLPDKRVSMGFQGMRGKKSVISTDHEELSKRAPMGFQGMRGKKIPAFVPVENEFLTEDTNKRTPMGFQGMRGKKNNLANDFQDTYLLEDYEKRAPMGFQGMRGKKTSIEDEYYKRAPMGFQGMRGKKSLEQILNELKKRSTMGLFQDLRGMETYQDDYPEDYEKKMLSMDEYRNIRDKEEFLREWEKRAPMGFQGTRGKKMILDALGDLDIHGVQGNQDTFDNYLDYSINPFGGDYKKSDMDFQDIEGGSELLKGARMGFHGMRDKRDATKIYGPNSSIARTTMGYQDNLMSNRRNDLAAYEIEKRSPLRYLGVRGKKNPRWEFRGKFVGVRGKKSSTLQTIGQGQAVF